MTLYYNIMQCKKLRASYQVLAKAVQSESRFLIAKIDGTANDLPSAWDVKGYPTILLFRADEKEKAEQKLNEKSYPIVPRHYWDAGYSLHELFGFLMKETSFDPRDLKVATSEQLGSLLGDEDILRAVSTISFSHENTINDYITPFRVCMCAYKYICSHLSFSGV